MTTVGRTYLERGRHHPSPPPRRPRNGHHADCPYPHQPAETCSICNGIRKAAHQEER